MSAPKELFVGLFTATICLIIVGNLCVIVTILRVKSVRSVQNYFVLSLAVSDLVMAVLVVPAPVIMMYHVLPDFMCRICHTSVLAAEVASIYSLVLIAMDRYRCIAQPFKRKIDIITCAILVSTVWALSIMYGLRRAFLNESPSASGQCGLRSDMKFIANVFKVVDFVVVFLFPLIFIAVIYAVIIWQLVKRKKMTSEEGAKKTNYVIYMLVLLVFLFLFCQGPIHCIDIYNLTQGPKVSWSAMMSLRTLQFARSWLNVCLYAYWNSELRQAFQSMFRRNVVKPMNTDSVTMTTDAKVAQ